MAGTAARRARPLRRADDSSATNRLMPTMSIVRYRDQAANGPARSAARRDTGAGGRQVRARTRSRRDLTMERRAADHQAGTPGPESTPAASGRLRRAVTARRSGAWCAHGRELGRASGGRRAARRVVPRWRYARGSRGALRLARTVPPLRDLVWSVARSGHAACGDAMASTGIHRACPVTDSGRADARDLQLLEDRAAARASPPTAKASPTSPSRWTTSPTVTRLVLEHGGTRGRRGRF